LSQLLASRVNPRWLDVARYSDCSSDFRHNIEVFIRDLTDAERIGNIRDGLHALEEHRPIPIEADHDEVARMSSSRIVSNDHSSFSGLVIGNDDYLTLLLVLISDDSCMVG